MRYGQSFNKPAAKVLRKARAQNGTRMFEADQLRRTLNALAGIPIEVDDDQPLTWKPDPPLRAMTLLAINAGYGAVDVSALPQSAVDLTGGWLTWHRSRCQTRICWRSLSECLSAQDYEKADLRERDAILYAAGSNTRHGVKRTQADKRAPGR